MKLVKEIKTDETITKIYDNGGCGGVTQVTTPRNKRLEMLSNVNR